MSGRGIFSYYTASVQGGVTVFLSIVDFICLDRGLYQIDSVLIKL